MHVEILSLFPAYFRGPFDESIVKRAQESGHLKITLTDLRDYSQERYRQVDDRPYGGGPGMVMMAEPVVQAVRSRKKAGSTVIYLSPRGKVLTAEKCKELALCEHLILLCGHYEGIDQRALDTIVDEEISIGDYVLTNGCLAAIVVVDSVVRFIPGVLGNAEAAKEDSFEKGLLDWPHYTRPRVFEEKEVPEVLFSGDHAKIAKWRLQEAKIITKEVRPDLWMEYLTGSDHPGEKRSSFSSKEVILPSQDLARSFRFYQKLFGASVELMENEVVIHLVPLKIKIIENSQFEGKAESFVIVNASQDLIIHIMKVKNVLETKFQAQITVSAARDARVMIRDFSGHTWIIKESFAKL